MNQNIYCLDTNAFIAPWNTYYSFEKCPDYWQILDNLAQQKIVYCPDQVKREIDKVEDGLKHWLDSKLYFVRIETEEVQKNAKAILAKYPHLISVGADRSMADPWVVAHAMADNAIVVSKEYAITQTQKASRIKIPDVCRYFNIKCINDFQFGDAIGIKLNAKI